MKINKTSKPNGQGTLCGVHSLPHTYGWGEPAVS